MLKRYIFLYLFLVSVASLACTGVMGQTSPEPTATSKWIFVQATPTESVTSTNTQPAVANNTFDETPVPPSPTPTTTVMPTTNNTSQVTPTAPRPMPITPEVSNLAITPIASCSTIARDYPITLSSAGRGSSNGEFESDLGPSVEPQNETGSFEPRTIQVQQIQLCSGSIDNFLDEISGIPQYALVYPVYEDPRLEKIIRNPAPNHLFVGSNVEPININYLDWTESSTLTTRITEVFPFANSIQSLIDTANTTGLNQPGKTLWIDSLVVEQVNGAGSSNLTTLYVFIYQDIDLPTLDCGQMNPAENQGIRCSVNGTPHLISSKLPIQTAEEVRVELEKDGRFLAESEDGRSFFLCDAQQCRRIGSIGPAGAASDNDWWKRICHFTGSCS